MWKFVWIFMFVEEKVGYVYVEHNFMARVSLPLLIGDSIMFGKCRLTPLHPKFLNCKLIAPT